MKFNLLKAAAVASVLVFNTAYADSIQVDLNGDSILSQAFDSFGIDYDSHTIVNTTTGAVQTLAGASLLTNSIFGNFLYSDFNTMAASGGINSLSSQPNDTFLRVEEGGTFALKDTYLSFGVNLLGTFSGAGINYTSGTLDLWQGYNDGSPAEKIMTSTFTSGGITGGNQSILSIAGSADILKDDVLFFDLNGTPISFDDYLSANPLTDIRLTIDQNVNGGAGAIVAAIGGDVASGFKGAQGDEVYVSAGHNAALTFNVPEPTTLAILGLGLLGMAGASRRKAK